VESDPAKLWSQYIQLTEVEAVIRVLKAIWPSVRSGTSPPSESKPMSWSPSLAVARSICPHSNGGSLVQASRWGLHLPGTHHSARSHSGRPHPSTRLALAPAAPAQNLQDHDPKCVDNLRPLNRESTERKSFERQKNAKVRLEEKLVSISSRKEAIGSGFSGQPRRLISPTTVRALTDLLCLIGSQRICPQRSNLLATPDWLRDTGIARIALERQPL
jgi:hypothetical protein